MHAQETSSLPDTLGSVPKDTLSTGASGVDTLVVYMAPKLLPGGRAWLAAPTRRLEDALAGKLEDVRAIDGDVRLEYRLLHRHDPNPMARWMA